MGASVGQFARAAWTSVASTRCLTSASRPPSKVPARPPRTRQRPYRDRAIRPSRCKSRTCCGRHGWPAPFLPKLRQPVAPDDPRVGAFLPRRQTRTVGTGVGRRLCRFARQYHWETTFCRIRVLTLGRISDRSVAPACLRNRRLGGCLPGEEHPTIKRASVAAGVADPTDEKSVTRRSHRMMPAMQPAEQLRVNISSTRGILSARIIIGVSWTTEGVENTRPAAPASQFAPSEEQHNGTGAITTRPNGLDSENAQTRSGAVPRDHEA